MAVISFAEGSSDAAWAVAGWAFRQLLADVMMLHPDDYEMAALFDQAEAVGFLRLGYLDRALSTRLATSIKEAAAGILRGTIRSGIVDRFNDEQTTQEYLKGLGLLLAAAQVGAELSA